MRRFCPKPRSVLPLGLYVPEGPQAPSDWLSPGTRRHHVAGDQRPQAGRDEASQRKALWAGATVCTAKRTRAQGTAPGCRAQAWGQEEDSHRRFKSKAAMLAGLHFRTIIPWARRRGGARLTTRACQGCPCPWVSPSPSHVQGPPRSGAPQLLQPLRESLLSPTQICSAHPPPPAFAHMCSS